MQQMQGMNVGIGLEQTLHFFAFLRISLHFFASSDRLQDLSWD